MIKAIITQRESMDAYGAPIDSLEAAYVRYLQGLGVISIPLPNSIEDVAAFADAVQPQLAVLTGGGNLQRGAYADPKHVADTQPSRDRAELSLVEWAIGHGVPILGVCRGFQFLNAYFGGLVSALPACEDRLPGVDHEVVWCATDESILVNNYHNDGVMRENLGEGLTPLVVDEKLGTIEAFETVDKRILGIQWHPERLFSSSKGQKITEEAIRKLIDVAALKN